MTLPIWGAEKLKMKDISRKQIVVHVIGHVDFYTRRGINHQAHKTADITFTLDSRQAQAIPEVQKLFESCPLEEIHDRSMKMVQVLTLASKDNVVYFSNVADGAKQIYETLPKIAQWSTVVHCDCQFITNMAVPVKQFENGKWTDDVSNGYFIFKNIDKIIKSLTTISFVPETKFGDGEKLPEELVFGQKIEFGDEEKALLVKHGNLNEEWMRTYFLPFRRLVRSETILHLEGMLLSLDGRRTRRFDLLRG